MFGDINNSISMISIKDVAILVTKGTTPTTLGYKFEPDGKINFVKMENISVNGNIQAPFNKITNECNSAMIRSELQEDDILISIAGTLGKTAIVTKEILPANTNQAVSIIRLDKTKKILPLYLYYYLKQERALSQYNELKKIANRANLSLDNIENIKIPLYRIELQYKFIDYAQSCDKLKFEAQKRLGELNATREELIDKFEVREFIKKSFKNICIKKSH